MTKKITLNIADKEIEFAPTQQLYGEYLGGAARGEITTASHNFVMQSVETEEDKQVLRELDEENAGAMTQIASFLVQEYAPKIEISVKKSTASLAA